MEAMLHGSDLSNTTLDFELAETWRCMIVTEFNQQSEREKERGFEGLEFMQHPPESAKAVAMNVEFINFVMYPLWEPLARFLSSQSERLEQLAKNRETWLERSRTKRLKAGGDK